MARKAGGGALRGLLLQAARQLCSSASAAEAPRVLGQAAPCLSTAGKAPCSSRAQQAPRNPAVSSSLNFGVQNDHRPHSGHNDHRPFSGHPAAAMQPWQLEPCDLTPSFPAGSSSVSCLEFRDAVKCPNRSLPRPRQQDKSAMLCSLSPRGCPTDLQHGAGPGKPFQEAAWANPPKSTAQAPSMERGTAQTPRQRRQDVATQWRLKLKLTKRKALAPLLDFIAAHHLEFSPQTACHALIKVNSLRRLHLLDERSRDEGSGIWDGELSVKTAAAVQLLAEKVELAGRGELCARDVANAAHSIARLGGKPRWSLMALALAAADIPAKSFNTIDLEQLLSACGRMQVQAPRLLEALEPRAAALATDMEPFQLSNILHSVFSQLRHPATLLYAASLESAPRLIPKMHVAALADLLVAWGDGYKILSSRSTASYSTGLGTASIAKDRSLQIPQSVLEIAGRRTQHLLSQREPRTISRRTLGHLLKGLSSVIAVTHATGGASRALAAASADLNMVAERVLHGRGKVSPVESKNIEASISAASTAIDRSYK